MEGSEGVYCKILSKEDFDNICRCCLSSSPLDNIFELMYEETMLDNIFYIVFGARLDPKDDLPKKICETCISELIRSYNFKKSYEASEATLLNIIAVKAEDLNVKTKLEALEENCGEPELNEENITDEMISDFKENEQCDYTSKNLEQEVNKKHQQSQIFTCSCNEDFSSRLEFHQHQESTGHHIARKHPCETCGKLFSKRSLWKHTRTHDSVKRYSCDQCEAKFAASGNLRRHMMIHTGEKPHVCEFCGKGFIQLTSLIAHRRTHTAKNPNKSIEAKQFVCDECGRPCNNQTAYKLHLYKKHGLSVGLAVKDGHQCKICKKLYASRCSLSFHMITHSEDKRFLCNECGKGFYRKSAFDLHALSHTGEKSFACEFCDKKFAWQGSLQKHRYVHTGEKPYACSLCPKKFRQNPHLTRHMIVHTGEKPYVCKFCDKAFPERYNLTLHIRIHTGEKPYKCNLCESMFYDARGLKKHKQRKHQ